MFSQSDVEASFDRATRDRGAAYRAQRRILDMDVDRDAGRILAQVRGSRPKPYDVVVALRDLRGARVSSMCSCPVGFNCKHGAAVAMEALASFATAADARARDAADGAVDSWIERLAGAGIAPAKTDQAIHYVLDAREVYYVPRVEIEAYVATALRDGTLTNVREAGIASVASSAGKYVTAADRAISRLAGAGAVRAGINPAEPAMLATLLELAIETGRLHAGEISNPPLRRRAIAGARLTWQTGTDGRQRPAVEDRPGLALIPSRPVWYLDLRANEAGPIDLGIREDLAAIAVASPSLTARQAARVQSAWRRAIEPSAAGAPQARPEPGFLDDEPRVELRLDAAAGFAFAQLRFAYGDRRVAAGDPADELVVAGETGTTRWRRRRDVEARAQERLFDLGLMAVGWPWNAQDERFTGAYRFAAGDDVGWAHLLHVELDRLRAAGWYVEIAPSFPITVARGDADWDAHVDGGTNENRWFELELGITVEGERISLLPLVVDALRTRSPNAKERGEPVYARLPRSGAFVAIPAERIDRIVATLVELFETDPLTAEGRLRLPSARAAVIEEIERGARTIGAGAPALRALLQRLASISMAAPAIELPASFRGELRPYQREGVAWLQALRDYGYGGVLADDMGLGKTVQLLAHAAIERECGRLGDGALVVAPTSVIPNWQAELERFTPHLRVLALTGPDRQERYDRIDTSDVVLTTYALLQRDADRLLARSWSLAVLDEAQAVKNPRSKGAAVARKLRAGQCLALTGTPVENHLDELWSIFAFAVPELLGDRTTFGRVFRAPIEKHRDDARQAALAARVRPFLLRRTKEVVAAELPPKTEIAQRVELEGPQRDLYETVRLAMHRRVRDEVSRRGVERSRIVVLDALLKLRQICCDPRLVKGPIAREGVGSAKLDALFDMLPDLIDDGRRILLFSQFTSMLDLIVAELERRKIRFTELRGSTKDRVTPVARFQRGEVPLFLISLRAGGTGLNLTAADTVIHYDPWWNPAVERQATDRTHRIGQDHPVFVYKLVTVGTVEERIVALQERKAELADRLFAQSDGAAFSQLDAADIDALFAPAHALR